MTWHSRKEIRIHPRAHVGLLANYLLCTLAASLNVLFGFFKFADALNIRFYYRYLPRVINIVVFSDSIDFWIWISSFLVIVLEMFLVKTRALAAWRRRVRLRPKNQH